RNHVPAPQEPARGVQEVGSSDSCAGPGRAAAQPCPGAVLGAALRLRAGVERAAPQGRDARARARRTRALLRDRVPGRTKHAAGRGSRGEAGRARPGAPAREPAARLPGAPARQHGAGRHARRRDARGREAHRGLGALRPREPPDRRRRELHEVEPGPRLGDLLPPAGREAAGLPAGRVAEPRGRARRCGADLGRAPEDARLRPGALARRQEEGLLGRLLRAHRHAHPPTQESQQAMTIHSSLRGVNTLTGERSVLTRAERITKLAKDGKFDAVKSNVWGLPKVRTHFKVAGAKKAKKEAAPGEGTPAEGADAAAPAAATAAPAKGAKEKAPAKGKK